METPSTPKADSSKKPIFVGKVETTGDYWSDLKEAFKRIEWSDFARIGEMACIRSSLLTGIASGVGIGVIRGLSARPFVASNWAVGTFMVISTGSWTICQKAKRDEIRRLQHVVEGIPNRYTQKENKDGSKSTR